jgi:hypothetical protein
LLEEDKGVSPNFMPSMDEVEEAKQNEFRGELCNMGCKFGLCNVLGTNRFKEETGDFWICTKGIFDKSLYEEINMIPEQEFQDMLVAFFEDDQPLFDVLRD